MVKRAADYLESYPHYSFSLITRYEILRGLRTKNAQKQLTAFHVFCQASEILPITDPIIECAATIYADLSRRGEMIGDADILIAATALKHNLIVATNNENHFSRITDLVIDNWSKS